MTVASVPESFRIRPIAPTDRAGLTRFYANLSTDSLEARFHGAIPGIGDGTARFLSGPDHEHREGFVAESADADGRRTIVGHVCLEPISAGQAEMAIAIADPWQHHGLGHAMVSQAIAWSRGHGVARLTASIRWSNGAMIGLIRSLGLPVILDDGDAGVVDAFIDLGVPLPRAV